MDIAHPITIRRATRSDGAAIAEVSVASWRESYGGILPASVLTGLSAAAQSGRYAAFCANRRVAAFVAVQIGRGIVGFGTCGPARGMRGGYLGEIYELYVRRFAAGQGAGRGLMRLMAAWLQSQSLEPAAVWVLRDNLAARGFYERLGGTLCAQKSLAFDGIRVPGVAYSYKDLDVLTGVGAGWPNLASPGL